MKIGPISLYVSGKVGSPCLHATLTIGSRTFRHPGVGLPLWLARRVGWRPMLPRPIFPGRPPRWDRSGRVGPGALAVLLVLTLVSLAGAEAVWNVVDPVPVARRPAATVHAPRPHGGHVHK